MSRPTTSPTYDLPTLEGLLAQLKTAFAHHVEVEDKRGARVLRLAGLELQVSAAGGTAQHLLDIVCERLAEVAAFGVATALTDASEAGTRQRMELVSALALIEATARTVPVSGGARPVEPGGAPLMTTAEVAAQLGMSRPDVSMLCDQGKLGAMTRSEGGHRRSAKSAVDSYMRAHQA